MFNFQIAEPFKEALPEGIWLIVDKGAQPDTLDPTTGGTVSGARRHDITFNGSIRPIIFKNSLATPLPEELAIKLLAADNFVRVDTDGRELEWKNPPRQIEDLQAGEKLELADTETIADLTELTLDSLRIRAVREKGGEKVKTANKETVVAFLVEMRQRKRAESIGRDPVQDPDMYDPDPDVFSE